MTLADIMDQKILELKSLEEDPHAPYRTKERQMLMAAIEILAKQIMKEDEPEPDHRETPTIQLYPGSKLWDAVHG